MCEGGGGRQGEPCGAWSSSLHFAFHCDVPFFGLCTLFPGVPCGSLPPDPGPSYFISKVPIKQPFLQWAFRFWCRPYIVLISRTFLSVVFCSTLHNLQLITVSVGARYLLSVHEAGVVAQWVKPLPVTGA